MSKGHFYSVTIIRELYGKHQSRFGLEGAHLWRNVLPDDLYLPHYEFDGWEVSTKGNTDVSSYEMFWYPKEYDSAIELLNKMIEMKDHDLMAKCDFRLMLIGKQSLQVRLLEPKKD